MNWHNVKNNQNDLPKENEEVIVRIDGGLFEYAIMIYLNGNWKGINVPDNRANIIEWSYIES